MQNQIKKNKTAAINGSSLLFWMSHPHNLNASDVLGHFQALSSAFDRQRSGLCRGWSDLIRRRGFSLKTKIRGSICTKVCIQWASYLFYHKIQATRANYTLARKHINALHSYSRTNSPVLNTKKNKFRKQYQIKLCPDTIPKWWECGPPEEHWWRLG